MTNAVSPLADPAPDRAGAWKPHPDPDSKVSPLAVPLPELPPLAGVRLNATEAGIRYQGRTDLVMMEVPAGSTCLLYTSRCV